MVVYVVYTCIHVGYIWLCCVTNNDLNTMHTVASHRMNTFIFVKHFDINNTV